jgi:hypothetical protein
VLEYLENTLGDDFIMKLNCFKNDNIFVGSTLKHALNHSLLLHRHKRKKRIKILVQKVPSASVNDKNGIKSLG